MFALMICFIVVVLLVVAFCVTVVIRDTRFGSFTFL